MSLMQHLVLHIGKKVQKRIVLGYGQARDLTASVSLFRFETRRVGRHLKENLVYTKQQADSTLRV